MDANKREWEKNKAHQVLQIRAHLRFLLLVAAPPRYVLCSEDFNAACSPTRRAWKSALNLR
jgi:hypothetical protein